MRRLGRLLMALGLGVGLVTVGAIGVHAGLVGIPWLLNVALAKLGIVASAALMAAGAGSIRLANRDEKRRLASGDQRPSGGPADLPP